MQAGSAFWQCGGHPPPVTERASLYLQDGKCGGADELYRKIAGPWRTTDLQGAFSLVVFTESVACSAGPWDIPHRHLYLLRDDDPEMDHRDRRHDASLYQEDRTLQHPDRRDGDPQHRGRKAAPEFLGPAS